VQLTSGSVITAGGNSSVVVNNILTGQSSVYLIPGVGVLGSVAVLQGTNPWQVNVPSPSTIAYQLAGSVLAVSGSFSAGNSSVQVVGIMPPQSVSGVGLFNVNHTGNGSVVVVGQYLEKSGIVASAFGMPMLFKNGADNSVLTTISTTNPLPVRGSITTLQGTNPWMVNVPSPSTISYQLAGSVLAVSGSFSSGPSSVELLSTSASIAVLVNRVLTGVSSVQLMAGTNNAGSITAIQGTTPWLIGNSSVQTIQGTTPWVVGSVITTVQSSVAVAVVNITSSIAANLQSTSASVLTKGFVTRNDTLASILGADLTARPMMGDSMGRTIIKPFAPEDSSIISYIGSLVSGSVALIQASAIGKRNYITDYWISNTGSVTQLVTFQGGDTSVLGFTVAPAGGGSNSPGIAIPLRTTISQDLAWKITGTSSVVYLTVKGYQAP